MKSNLLGIALIVIMSIFLISTIGKGMHTQYLLDSIREMDDFNLLVSTGSDLGAKINSIAEDTNVLLFNAKALSLCVFLNFLIFLVAIVKLIRKPVMH